MTRNPAIPTYSHKQKAPLCLLVYALAVVFIVLGYIVEDAPPIPWLFPPIGLLMLVVAASFHHLKVEDQGDVLSVSFGPIPLFRKTLNYSDIVKVEVGQTLLLDGWGIHMSIRGGWVWNIWGRDCVVLHLKEGTLRIGTDDAKNLAGFIEQRIGSLPPTSSPISHRTCPKSFSRHCSKQRTCASNGSFRMVIRHQKAFGTTNTNTNGCFYYKVPPECRLKVNS